MDVGDVITAKPLVDKVDDVLNPDQRAQLSRVLARNGWGPPNSQTNMMARAVVQRESNGDPNATNPSGATGLFQMMTPLHCGDYGIPRDNCQEWLKDPDNNAKAARQLHRQAGWQPWATSGPIPPPPTKWDPAITTDRDSLSGGAGEAIAGAAGAVASPFTQLISPVLDFVGALLTADTWFRIGKTWLGFVFVVAGVGAFVFIIANQASGGRAGKVAKAAATKGMVK